VPTPYFLHGDGELSPEKPAAHAPISFRYDPRHPVPTLGGNNSSQGALATQGVADQRCHAGVGFCADSNPLSARNDVAVFQTPALAQDLEITGRLIVKLWAASDCPDTDFTAKLIDEYPPSLDFPAGFDLNVGDSIVRARYRNSLTKAEFLRPGQPYEFTIELYPTSLLVKRGHRIRLDISSSNFPRFDLNPNTGEPLNDNRSWRVAENSIYLDSAHPSRIILPLIPLTR
jgi:putative CocE/NonD family hydrolase